MNTCLTVAGSDPSGGAGIQADLKTFAALGVYGMSVVTAVTVQNTLGVTHIHSIPSDVVAQQLRAVLTDIPPTAIKIGMLDNASTVVATVNEINNNIARQFAPPVVIDPVLVSSSGRNLLSPQGIELLVLRLFPLAELITPNTNELQVLSQALQLPCPVIKTEHDLQQAGTALHRRLELLYGRSPNILCKGGHLEGDAVDLLLTDGQYHWLRAERVINRNTHGTGCTLSAAIAANLASGLSLVQSVQTSKAYVHSAIERKLNLGQGAGPLAHQ